MPEQETLPTQDGTPIDALHNGLWKRVVDGNEINHAAWLRACAESGFVGTCRECGSFLRPEPPEQVGNRYMYTASCVVELSFGRAVDSQGIMRRTVEGCGKEVVAPGGRIVSRSTRFHERPKKDGKNG